MLLPSKFAYDLTGRPKPSREELDEEIDRLLLIKSAEEPEYLADMKTRDQLSNLDAEVLCHWIRRRFQPALLLLLLESENNYQYSKDELCKMKRFQTIIDKFFRTNFVYEQAIRRIEQICFDNPDCFDLKKSLVLLKKTLVFLSQHLDSSSPDSVTLQGTDVYTPADVALYNSIKRILVGNFKDSGLKTHVRLCEPLTRFMKRFAEKNRLVIDVSSRDPLADKEDEPSLLVDILKPTLVACAVITFFLWRKG